MALQMRLLGRQMSWSQAVRGFLLRYAAANAFATCRTLERCRGTDSMWEWQWALLCRRYCTDVQPRRNIHVPVGGAQRCNYEANPRSILYIRQLVVNSMSRAFNLHLLLHCVVATPCA